MELDRGAWSVVGVLGLQEEEWKKKTRIVCPCLEEGIMSIEAQWELIAQEKDKPIFFGFTVSAI